MFKSRMLDNVKLSLYIPPIWLAVLISIGFYPARRNPCIHWNDSDWDHHWNCTCHGKSDS